MVLCVQLLKTSRVDLVLELCDSEVLDFNWVRDGPLKADWDGRQGVGVLDELQLSSSMEGLTLEADGERLTIHDLEEDGQVVLANLLGVVKNIQVHLLARGQRPSSWLNLKNLSV